MYGGKRLYYTTSLETNHESLQDQDLTLNHLAAEKPTSLSHSDLFLQTRYQYLTHAETQHYYEYKHYQYPQHYQYHEN